MRVITGTAKGRRLKELSGTETRPTTDRVKEGLFNIVQFDLEGRRVLDLFAGTGQLGIEALSRGAALGVFVDQRRDAVDLIEDNLAHCGLRDRARVRRAESIAYLSACRESFHLIFLDPPYAGKLLENALEKIVHVDILTENGIMICESPAEKQLPDLPAPYRKDREYRYGKIKLTVYRKDVAL